MGGGSKGSLIFPKVPQSSLGILRVPQLPPSPLNNPIRVAFRCFGPSDLRKNALQKILETQGISYRYLANYRAWEVFDFDTFL